MKLIDAELGHTAWQDIPCGCGQDAGHIPALIRAAVHEDDREAFARVLEHHAVISSNYILEPAVPLTSVFFAVLADDTSTATRYGALEMIELFVAPEGQAHGVPDGRDLVEECRGAARLGIWMLYQLMFAGDDLLAAAFAFTILLNIETDHGRVLAARDAAGDLLPEYQRTWTPDDDD